MEARGRFRVDDLWTPRDLLPGKGVLGQIAERCGRAWDFASLPEEVRIVYNPRLRTALGRAFPRERRVELNARLLRAHPQEFIPTLAHELAHVVVYIRYGRVRPHGMHFRTLMRAVDLSPQATHSLPVGPAKRRRRRYLYLHRCSDCGAGFVARKVRRDLYCRCCGPDMAWAILRAADTAAGRRALGEAMAALRLATGDRSP